MSTLPYDFSHWYAKLVADALQHDIDDQQRTGKRIGYSAHMRMRGAAFWRYVYNQGVSPTVDSVIEWAAGDLTVFTTPQSDSVCCVCGGINLSTAA